MRRTKLACALALGALSTSASALEWSFEDWGVDATLNTHVTAGVAIRMQDRADYLLGKLNVPGQMNLCEADNCLSLSDDPAPNQRLVNAPGAFSGVNGDDGNINYDKGDLVAGTIKVMPDFSAKYGEFLVRVRALGFYDPVNVDFDETHFDTRMQAAHSKRPGNVERVFAKGINLYDAYAQYAFTWGGRQGTVSVGNQLVRWGESTLVALNSLSEINPPNAAILRMPGGEINEVFQPVPLLLLSSDIVDGVSAEFVYQLGWKKTQADPRGSFMADLDLIDGNAAYVSLGQFGENPNELSATRGELAMVSSDTATVFLGSPHEPKSSGQYGLRLNYFADWLNGGTEMGFYYLKYHSRLPYATVVSTDESCARDSTNLASAIFDCHGFNGSLTPLLNPISGGEPIDPLPIRTMGAYLEYPEGLTMYGLSFNTNVGSFSLAGEFSYRPDMPLQVQLADLIFAGLQPALPAQPLETPSVVACDLNPLNDPLTSLLCGLQGIHFPSADEAIPSYIAHHRGFVNTDPARRIGPHQTLKGWENFDVMQLDFTAIKAVSNNPFGADQILFINEVGATYVDGMPDRDEFQLQGAGVYYTSASLGGDGSGTPDAVSQPCKGSILTPVESQACHLTPTTQTDGFGTAFSWGLRSITRFEYNDVMFGWSFKPTVIIQWDIGGISPFPIQNFVEGRKDIVAGTEVTFTEALTGRILYQWFTGGGRNNTRADRDNVALSVGYNF